MIEMFLNGMIAGYGIAIPVGAIAVLIIDVSVRHGFRTGFAAGAGAASADLLYAALAAGAGGLLAPLIAPASSLIGMVSGAILLLIALSGLRSLQQQKGSRSPAGLPQTTAGTFLRFVALTIVNPLTVVYFSALLLGTSIGELTTASLLVFIAGAFLASLSWQTLLAALGAWAHVSAGTTFRRASGLVGNLVILGFAVTTLLRSLP